MVGVLLIVGGDASGEASLVGDLLMVGTVIVWVVYGFLTLRMSRRFPVGAITNVAILWGVVTLAPLALAELAVTGIPRPSPGALAAVVALGVFCSALAYVAWNQALTVLGVTATNSLIYGIPVVAVIGAVWLLDEPLTVEIAVGGALVIAGLVAANLRTAPTHGP
jgi:drug/metabolite transporter (DMT)-like permease